MANNSFKYFILTGDPGVGKTTLTKKICSTISSKGIKPTGFYTEEVRKSGLREGFDVVTFNQERGRLARDINVLNCPVKCKVGKYGVLVEEFEKIAIPSLQPTDVMRPFIVIDEIGKMEFFSAKFKTKIQEIFNPTSNFIVLATIPIRNRDPIIESIRSNNKAKVWLVTRDNRNRLHEEILISLLEVLKCEQNIK